MYNPMLSKPAAAAAATRSSIGVVTVQAEVTEDEIVPVEFFGVFYSGGHDALSRPRTRLATSGHGARNMCCIQN